MKMRLLPALAGLAIGFAVPSIAQDAMKVVTADELVWKEHPVFKGAQTVILVGDPTKAETIVQRVKFPPHFKVPPHTHPYSEVVTVLYRHLLRRARSRNSCAPLGIEKNERVGRVTEFCSHQPDLCCFQKWLAVLTDAASQVRIPKREFSLGLTEGTFA